MRIQGPLASSLLVAAGLVVVGIGQPACSECLALPACDADEIEVEACADGDTSCHEVEACGNTIFCQEAAQCDAVPTCGAGQIEVAECPADATCTPVSLCGMTILCMDSGPCASSADCAEDEYCAFPDGACGAGEVGECQPRPMVCSDGPLTCFCDGTISDLGCAGISGVDVDATGTACTPPATAISCAELVCDGGTTDYCTITMDDTGGPPFASCGVAPTGCDPATCACLTDETSACLGTCEDGPNGPTIHCPGG